MKRALKALGLTLILSSPITLGQIAVAQVILDPIPRLQQHLPIWSAEAMFSGVVALNEAAPMVAQSDSQDDELSACLKSDYDYWDIAVLASFWNEEMLEAKKHVGRELLWGDKGRTHLSLMLTDARVQALGSVEELRFFGQSDWSYDDAAALALYWEDGTPYDAKLRVERNLILGNSQAISDILKLSAR